MKVEELIAELKALSNLSYPLTEMNMYDKLGDFYNKYHQDFNLEHGISRCVIIPMGEDYVVKIPFSHTVEEECYTEEEIEEDEIPIECCEKDDDGLYHIMERIQMDYCEHECYLYALAEDENLEAVFAKEYQIDEINGIPIYIQTRAESFEYYSSASVSNLDSLKLENAKDDIQTFCQTNNNAWCFNKIWLAEALLKFGQEFINRLFEFLNNNYINDLHNGNLGYIDDVPVIFDYASFDG